MFAILLWMGIPFFFVIVQVIITTLAVFSPSTFLWVFLSPWWHWPPVICLWHDVSKPGLMHLKLIISCIGGKLRTSYYTHWDFTSINVALPLPVLIDWKIPEKICIWLHAYFGVTKPCIAEVLEELLVLWTITVLSIYLVPLNVTNNFSRRSLHCVYSFSFSLLTDLVPYYVRILVETPKLVSDPTLTIEC